MRKSIAVFWLLTAAISAVRGEGYHVKAIETNSPADRAGVKVGDVIVAANGRTIQAHSDIVAAAREANTGLRMIVRRGEKTEEMRADLTASSQKGSRLGVQCRYNEGRAGRNDDLSAVRSVPRHSLSIGVGGVIPNAELDTEFFIGKATYSANALGNSLGLAGAEAGGVNGLVMVRLGKRFGTTGTPANFQTTPTPKQTTAPDGVM